jgi:hypothetical protein
MMAKPTPHAALENMGFKLVGSGFNGSSDRVGTATTHHYSVTRNTVGKGNIVRPIVHNVFVDEFSKHPGKYNVSYHVTQDGTPYGEGDYDTRRSHRDNMSGGVKDPIAEVMQHHRGVTSALNNERAHPLVNVNRDNIHMLMPAQQHMNKDLMVHLNSSNPVSDEDWESFVAGRNPIRGMMSDGTPVVDHFDPNFGQMGPENVGGGRTFINLPHAVQKSVVGDPEVYEPRGNCVTCGKPTWNTSDGGEAPEWEHTGNAHYANEYGMHGPDIPQCANCANDYDTYKEAIRSGERPGGMWHHPGSKINSCPTCYEDEVG